ncbi:MAG: MFS transporter [Chromatiales bacterium]|jgi:UMF1 family MFS transporter|nr:MFS transporter [Chromatiales bacterium]
MKKILLRRPVLAWALYDWANSAFATTVMAGFFPAFYSFLSKDLSASDSQFWFNMTLTGSSVLVAISAPVLGAIADRGGSRKKFLATFAMLGVVMTAAMAWVNAGQWELGLIFYALGTVGFSGANVFYDSMLVDVSAEEEFDLISAFGYAMGYVGGGILFAVNVMMVGKPELFGIEDAGTAVKLSFLSVAVWWAAFSIPLLLGVKETPTAHKATRLQAVREGLAQLAGTFREIRQLRVLVVFLLGYWLYIDAVNTVIKTAVFFGDRILNLPAQGLMVALLVTQFVAFPSALFFGWLGKRIGPRPAILIGLSVYVIALLYAWRWLEDSGDFYVLAIAIGLVQGGVQSLSRSLYARLIPVSKTAEFFGFFNMVGKFAAILGPLLMAMVPIVIVGADERDSIMALNILFFAGGFLLWRVNVEEGVRAAKAMDNDHPGAV